MVQFGETTYRIAEVSRGRYEAFRILDDVRMGTFETTPTLRVNAQGTDEKVLFAVARTALMQAKTSWLAPGAEMENAKTPRQEPVPRKAQSDIAPAAMVWSGASARSRFRPVAAAARERPLVTT